MYLSFRIDSLIKVILEYFNPTHPHFVHSFLTQLYSVICDISPVTCNFFHVSSLLVLSTFVILLVTVTVTAYSSLFYKIPDNSRQFLLILGNTSLLYPLPAFACLFHPIPAISAYSIQLQPS